MFASLRGVLRNVDIKVFSWWPEAVDLEPIFSQRISFEWRLAKVYLPPSSVNFRAHPLPYVYGNLLNMLFGRVCVGGWGGGGSDAKVLDR